VTEQKLIINKLRITGTWSLYPVEQFHRYKPDGFAEKLCLKLMKVIRAYNGKVHRCQLFDLLEYQFCSQRGSKYYNVDINDTLILCRNHYDELSEFSEWAS
jgi:hypothetical protein